MASSIHNLRDCRRSLYIHVFRNIFMKTSYKESYFPVQYIYIFKYAYVFLVRY